MVTVDMPRRWWNNLPGWLRPWRRNSRKSKGLGQKPAPLSRRAHRANAAGDSRALLSHEERLNRDALAYLVLHSSLRHPMGHAYWLAELAPLLLDDHLLWWKRLSLPGNWPDDDGSR